MSTFKTKFWKVSLLSALVLGVLSTPTTQVRGDSDEDVDVLFECVQATYGQKKTTESATPLKEVEPEPCKSTDVLVNVVVNSGSNTSEPTKTHTKVQLDKGNTDVASLEQVPVSSEGNVQSAAPMQLSAVPQNTMVPAQTPAASAGPVIRYTPQSIVANPVSKGASDVSVSLNTDANQMTQDATSELTSQNIDSQEPQQNPVLEVRAVPNARTGNAAGADLDDQGLGEEELEWNGPFQVYHETEEMKVIAKRSLLMRTRYNLMRTAIVDPSICDIVQFTPRELSIIGRAIGSTHVTFWFEDGSYKPITFVVHTVPDPSVRDLRAEKFKVLEMQLAKMFPNSKISLILLANKLIIRGQARSAEEAAEILRILREDNATNQYGDVAVAMDEETGLPNQRGLIIVNQLRVPGIQTVALKVKLADLSRSNATSSGVDFAVKFDGDKIALQSLMGAMTGGGGLLSYSSADVNIAVNYLVTEGVIRQMSESTLVTMSGTSATFSTGGEIPVPTVTGVSGASAVTTGFRSYGTVINFTPTVLDKDLIRLYITSEFSSIGEGSNKVSGVPNLDSRTLNSEIQMREGQTFCLATVLEDNYSAGNSSNIPILSKLIGHKSKSRGEREMVILVSPELVAPMEPEEVPPLPGFDVTEPSNTQFHILGKLEGTPTRDYRSTVWPSLRNRYLSGGSAIISGPFGH